MPRNISWDREAMRQMSPSEEISSTFDPRPFTPINQEPSSFKSAPRRIRRRSEVFCEIEEASDKLGERKTKAKRRKTEPNTHDAFGNEENTSVGHIPKSLLPKTPPKLMKKKTTRKKSATANQQEPFPEVPITKLRQPGRKKSTLKSKTISHQGFTTTEDELKTQVKLAQTTLDKLASFKYNPTLVNEQAEAPRPGDDSNGSNIFAVNSQSLSFNDHVDEEYVPLTASQTIMLDQENARTLDVAHFEDAYFEDEEPMFHSPHDEYPYGEDFQSHPAFSDHNELDSLADEFGMGTSVCDTNLDINQETEINRHQDLQDPRPIAIESRDVTDNVMIRDDLSDHNLPEVTVGPKTNMITPVTSSMQGAELEDMEFDDHEIADEDLLAMSFTGQDGRNCDTEAELSTGSKNAAFYPVAISSSQKFNDLGLDRLALRDDPPCNDSAQPAPLNPVENDGSPDSDDEFSLDEAEKEALMQFDVQTGAVIETFPPPSSIPFPSDCESRDLEVYDRHLQYSDPSAIQDPTESGNAADQTEPNQSSIEVLPEEDWSFLQQRNRPSKADHRASNHQIKFTPLIPHRNAHKNQVGSTPKAIDTQNSSQSIVYDESAEYLPLTPFARPEFPKPMLDRSPVIGFSGSLVLRTCFRIGEALRIASVSDSANYEILMELYARVTFSEREEGTVKQHFQFADLFHDRPPFLNGILENYKVSDLANIESKDLLGAPDGGYQVRCLGRMRREFKGKRVLVIENIRKTDWEEIDRTKRIIEDLSGKLKPEDQASWFDFGVR